MTERTGGDVFTDLRKPFSPKWRVKQVKKGDERINGKYPVGAKAAFIPYIDVRDVAQRLDDAVLPQNWQTQVKAVNADGSVIVTLILRVDGEWIVREDIGYPNNPDTKLADADQLKGAVSDGIKRAAVQFGIGRALYALKPVWVEIDEWGNPKQPITVGRLDPGDARVIDGSTGEITDAPAPRAAKQTEEVAGPETPPAEWKGKQAFWRNKIDAADTIEKLEIVTGSVGVYCANNSDPAVMDYLMETRKAIGLLT